METPPRTPYPSDVSDDEWAFLAPYLTLMRVDAPQRRHDLRELFNGLRFIARTGLQWRFMPNDLPPWTAVYQQTRRWLAADVFAAIIADLRTLIRLGEGRSPQPSAVIFDSRTLQSTPKTAIEPVGTGRNGARGARSTSPSTPSASGWRCTSPRPTPRVWRWRPSSCPTPSAASCSCRAAGWSSAASAGWRASAAWPATRSVGRGPAGLSPHRLYSCSCGSTPSPS